MGDASNDSVTPPAKLVTHAATSDSAVIIDPRGSA
jgi:hypothetical protein